MYNFGLLAFVPLASLIGYTAVLLWRNRASLWHGSPLAGLAVAVAYMLVLGNMFKVPLRQPFPGIFFFFLRGLLIARLHVTVPSRG